MIGPGIRMIGPGIRMIGQEAQSELALTTGNLLHLSAFSTPDLYFGLGSAP
jgi:hypothetical protein